MSSRFKEWLIEDGILLLILILEYAVKFALLVLVGYIFGRYVL